MSSPLLAKWLYLYAHFGSKIEGSTPHGREGAVMDLLILFVIGVSFTTIVFFIGRYACPRRDRVPLMEVDHILLWTTLRRGWHAIGSFGPITNMTEGPSGTHPA